jgi:hypothetical protein
VCIDSHCSNEAKGARRSTLMLVVALAAAVRQVLLTRLQDDSRGLMST